MRLKNGANSNLYNNLAANIDFKIKEIHDQNKIKKGSMCLPKSFRLLLTNKNKR